MAPMALSNIRVLDFTQTIAGPYCTKLLADYGADVIKVERPGIGDGARRMGPFPKDEPHPEKSGTFLHLNTNKRSITLNLKTAQGQEVARAWLRRSMCWSRVSDRAQWTNSIWVTTRCLG